MIRVSIMDPSKQQSNSGSSKEVNSLESTDTVIETEDTSKDPQNNGDAANDVIDATGGNTSAGPGASSNAPGGDSSGKKVPIIKRLWHKFNIYLLLFILVVLV